MTKTQKSALLSKLIYIEMQRDRLLAALQGIMKWWTETPSFQDGEDDMPADLFDAARDAIAKATGG